jgi:hypothetical protein
VRHVDVPPGTAPALSLVMRIPAFAISFPGLITWQAMGTVALLRCPPSKQLPFVIGGM